MEIRNNLNRIIYFKDLKSALKASRQNKICKVINKRKNKI